MSYRGSFRTRFPGVTSILRNGALWAGTQWAETGLRAVYAVLIGRLLGPEIYGVWSLALATYAFAIGFTYFGLETLVPLRLGRDRKVGAFLGTTLLLRLILVVLATAVTGVCILAFETELFSRTAMLIVLPALVGRGIVLWARSVFLGLERSQIAFRLAFTLRLSELAAGLFFLWLGAGLYSLLVIHATTWLAEAALSLIVLSRQVTLKIGLGRTEFREILRKGAILGLVTTGLAALTSMPVILTRFVSDDLVAVGQIAMAIQVASLVVMAMQGVFAAALPVVSRAFARGDPRLRYYSVFAGLGVAVVFGVSILVAQAIGPKIFGMVLGSGFASAGALLAPALVSAGIMVAPTGIWHLLVTADRIWAGVIAGWSGALILLLTLPPMVHALGASGALAAAAVGWTVRAVILVGWSLTPATTKSR